MVIREAAILLGNDEKASWDFVDMCRVSISNAYKQNMIVIQELETAYYGNDSYFHLLETGQYREPQHEGDYSGPAAATAVTPIEDAEGNNGGNMDNNVDNDNVEDSVYNDNYNVDVEEIVKAVVDATAVIEDM